jgi:antitoxin YefM
MRSMSTTEVREQLCRLLDEVAESHEAVQIVGKRHSAVLVAEEDWRAIQETLYLTSIPGMKESIVKGLRTPVGKCDPITLEVLLAGITDANIHGEVDTGDPVGKEAS